MSAGSWSRLLEQLLSEMRCSRQLLIGAILGFFERSDWPAPGSVDQGSPKVCCVSSFTHCRCSGLLVPERCSEAGKMKQCLQGGKA